MKKILIVEDERPLLKALSEKFNNEGFEVLKAGDGKEGLDMALTKEPDIILLDIVMPVMDGISMLKNLRRDNSGKDIPVIILTNLSDAEHTADALENKAYDFLVKSDWKLEDVVKKVKEKLNII